MMEADPGYVGRLHLVGPPWLVSAWLRGDWSARPVGGFFDVTKLRLRHTAAHRSRLRRDRPRHQGRRRPRSGMEGPGLFRLGDMGASISTAGIGSWDVYRKQVDTSKLLDVIFALHDKYKVRQWYMEGGAIHRSVEPFWRERMEIRGQPIPIEPVPAEQRPAIRPCGPRRCRLCATTGPCGSPWIRPMAGRVSGRIADIRSGEARKDEIHDDQIDAGRMGGLEGSPALELLDPSKKRPAGQSGPRRQAHGYAR